MIGTARHYDDDMDIQRYDDAEVTCDRDTDDDGKEIIRIEALGGEEGIVYSWGRPGVSIELSMDDAISLMARLSEVTMPPSLRLKCRCGHGRASHFRASGKLRLPCHASTQPGGSWSRPIPCKCRDWHPEEATR